MPYSSQAWSKMRGKNWNLCAIFYFSKIIAIFSLVAAIINVGSRATSGNVRSDKVSSGMVENVKVEVVIAA